MRPALRAGQDRPCPGRSTDAWDWAPGTPYLPARRSWLWGAVRRVDCDPGLHRIPWRGKANSTWAGAPRRRIGRCASMVGANGSGQIPDRPAWMASGLALGELLAGGRDRCRRRPAGRAPGAPLSLSVHARPCRPGRGVGRPPVAQVDPSDGHRPRRLREMHHKKNNRQCIKPLMHTAYDEDAHHAPPGHSATQGHAALSGGRGSPVRGRRRLLHPFPHPACGCGIHQTIGERAP